MRAERVTPDAAHADTIRTTGPRAVSRSVLLRLERLPPQAVAVARAIAVLGDGANLPATAALANLDERSVVEATRALVAAEILLRGPPLGFVHAIVRDAVYRELTASERELEHERAARSLADLGAPPRDRRRSPPCRGAAWRALGGRHPAACGRTRNASRRPASAGSYLRRALDERAAGEDRPQLLFELGWAESQVNVPSAIEHLRDAGDLLADPLQQALVAEILAGILLLHGAAEDAVQVAQAAIAVLGDRHGDQRRALESMELYAVAFGAVCPMPLVGWRACGRRGSGPTGRNLLAAVAGWDRPLRGGSAP